MKCAKCAEGFGLSSDKTACEGEPNADLGPVRLYILQRSVTNSVFSESYITNTRHELPYLESPFAYLAK